MTKSRILSESAIDQAQYMVFSCGEKLKDVATVFDVSVCVLSSYFKQRGRSARKAAQKRSMQQAIALQYSVVGQIQIGKLKNALDKPQLREAKYEALCLACDGVFEYTGYRYLAARKENRLGRQTCGCKIKKRGKKNATRS